MNNTNREVKIAIGVGLIMLTLCLIAFIVQKEKNKPTELLDLHVYKHIITDKTNNSGTYYECNLATEDLSRINIEFKKIMSLGDNHKREGNTLQGIRGDYKVVAESNFLAFDNSKDNVVYRNDTTSLYNYRSTLYEIVEKACAGITKDTVTQQETKKKDTSDKKDTKKSTSTKKSSKK